MKSTMIITILLVCFSSICHSASLDDDEPYYGMATGLTEYIGPFYTNYPGTINISISTNPSTLLYLELDKNGESVATSSTDGSGSSTPKLSYTVDGNSNSFDLNITNKDSNTVAFQYSVTGGYPDDTTAPSPSLSVSQYSNQLSNPIICSATDSESGIKSMDLNLDYSNLYSWSFTPEESTGAQNFTFTVPESSPSATYALECVAKDEAGNSSSSLKSITIDRVAPIITIDFSKTPSNNSTLSDNSVDIYYAVSDDFSGISSTTISLNGTNVGPGYGSDTISNLKQGSNVITITRLINVKIHHHKL